MLTTGEADTPSAEPEPADVHMSWVKRVSIALFVVLAIVMVAAGVWGVRRVLDHSVDPSSLLERSASRLTSLAPEFSALEVDGTDSVSMVGCQQRLCASAARRYLPSARLTTAGLIVAADSWASTTGLGNPGGAYPNARAVGCGALEYAPVPEVICDVGVYAVPGLTDQQVHVYAQLDRAGKAVGTSPGAYSLAQVGALTVSSVYVQVITTAPLP